MPLTQIAAFADIAAAIGVILSLVFLAYELRLTRKQSELSNWRDLLQSVSDFKKTSNDLSFAAFLERANQDYDALSPAEQHSFGHYLEQGIHIYGNFIKHNDTVPRKLVGLEEAVNRSLHDLLSTPGARAWYAQAKPKGRLMPQTYVMIDQVLSS
jgi:hypothetical protein